MTDYLGNRCPGIADHLRKKSFAELPTPVTGRRVRLAGATKTLSIKHDDQTSALYGGNKIRKLEYILQRARDRGARRVATFGAVGSNHALATAIFAREFGLECTCFLGHQPRSPAIAKKLDAHLDLGTEIVRYGGAIDPLPLFRRYLQNRATWVIPLGGTCWLGAVGFVNAGLELAAQIEAGDLDVPGRIYMANGTMGSVAGLALGLALAKLPTEIHAVRIASNQFTRREVLERLMMKTAVLLHRFDSSIPADLAKQTRIVWRDDFYAGGYAAVDKATSGAVEFAADALQLNLETTYTGKAMAAMLHDLKSGAADDTALFWNTYNSNPLPALRNAYVPHDRLPGEFERYYSA